MKHKKEKENIVDESIVNNEQDNNQNNNEEQLKKMEESLLSLQNELSDTKDKLIRTVAEFDNFRKRTVKEKETIFKDGVSDAVCEFLPVLDNLQRAVMVSDDADTQTIIDGVKMVLKQFEESFSKLGVERITALGEQFNPELHNAVIHIEDEAVTENTVIEEFICGYKINDKVIRHSVVKVAN